MVASQIGLEGQIILNLRGVQVHIKPEAVVSKDNHSSQIAVPVIVYKDERQKEGQLIYATDKQIFLSTLTYLFPEAEISPVTMMHIAGKYSAMLNLGYVKVREVSYDGQGNLLEEKVYGNYHDYCEQVGERQLDELRKQNPRNKTSP